MVKNEVLSSAEVSLEESSPSANIPGEEFVDTDVDIDIDVDDLAYNERYGNDVPYQHYGYIPIYYPMPTSYYIYNLVTPVEYNGTVFYNYHQVAVPDYSYSLDEVTSDGTIASDFNSIISHPNFVGELEEQVDENSSQEFSSENSNSTDLNDSDPEEVLGEFEEFYEERYSSQIMAENRIMAIKRDDEIMMRKDWLYLLSLSGKLRLKNSIPDVQILPMITEDEEQNNEIDGISDEELESPILDEVLWKKSSPLIDKSDGDHDKECRNDDAIDASNDNMSMSEFHDRLGDKDFWDSIFASIDEGENDELTESCFSGSSENQLVIESSDSEIDEYNSNSQAVCRKERKRLRLLTKDIDILPTINEEDEPPGGDGDIKHRSEKIVPNKENDNVVKDECVQPLPVEGENDCGLSEATIEAGPSQKPNKKRFKGLRRLISRLTSCCRKNKEPPG